MNIFVGRLRAEWDSCAIGLTAFIFHLWHVKAVSRAPIFAKENLAFDFDIDRFVALWGDSPFPTAYNPSFYASRHPLAVLVRLICRPLVGLGLDAHLAACSFAALTAAISTLLAHRIALALGVPRCLSWALAVFWAFSTASLFLGVLPETYGLAFVALSAQFLLAIHWIKGHEPPRAARIAVAVASFGITITNVVLSGLSEFICRLGGQPPRKALLGTAGFSAVVVLIGVILGAVSFQIWPVDHSKGAASAAKQVYWDMTSAERTVERQSPGAVVWTFAAIAFVAPKAARYPSGDADTPYLWDLRGASYGAAGWIAVLGWLALLLLGVFAAATDTELRPVWIIAATWIAANLILHSYWQFRDTIFLYSAHSHMAIFLLALAGARWAKGHAKGMAVYCTVLALVILCTALNNIPAYLALARID